MALDVLQLTQMSHGNGFARYRYDTLDAHAVVDTTGYFNNVDDNLKLSVGDLIEVVVWATAVRSGTIATYGKHIVLSVSAAGVVDLSDVTVGVVTDTD